MLKFLEILKSVLLGIVEGITEWLPVSSTGHLILLLRVVALRTGEAVSEEVLSFLCLLTEKGRMGIFHETLKEYGKLDDLRRRVTEARVVTAHPLSEEEKARLTQRLSSVCGKQVEASFEVDGALLGGVLVEMDGRTYDGSLRFRLQDVKDEISR